MNILILSALISSWTWTDQININSNIQECKTIFVNNENKWGGIFSTDDNIYKLLYFNTKELIEQINLNSLIHLDDDIAVSDIICECQDNHLYIYITGFKYSSENIDPKAFASIYHYSLSNSGYIVDVYNLSDMVAQYNGFAIADSSALFIDSDGFVYLVQGIYSYAPEVFGDDSDYMCPRGYLSVKFNQILEPPQQPHFTYFIPQSSGEYYIYNHIIYDFPNIIYASQKIIVKPDIVNTYSKIQKRIPFFSSNNDYSIVCSKFNPFIDSCLILKPVEGISTSSLGYLDITLGKTISEFLIVSRYYDQYPMIRCKGISLNLNLDLLNESIIEKTALNDNWNFGTPLHIVSLAEDYSYLLENVFTIINNSYYLSFFMRTLNCSKIPWDLSLPTQITNYHELSYFLKVDYNQNQLLCLWSEINNGAEKFFARRLVQNQLPINNLSNSNIKVIKSNPNLYKILIEDASYQDQSKSNLTASIFNLQGKLVKTLAFTKENSIYQAHWQTSKVVSGIYFIMWDLEEKSQKRKLVVVK